MSELPRIVRAGDREVMEQFSAPDEAPDSLITRLRTRAAEATKERTIDLPVPGWSGELVLRFRTMDVATLDRLLAQRQEGKVSAVNESIDAMAQACIGVYGREDNGLTQLADVDGPVRLEHRLGVLLAMPNPTGETMTAREVVLALFGGNAFALGAYVDRLVEWMADPDTAGPPPGES